MYGHLLQHKIQELLNAEHGRAYAIVVGIVAFSASLTMTVPFAGPLIVAVLAKPQKWKGTVIASAVGSALGATCLLVLFHHSAWGAFLHWHPHIATGASWIALDGWLEKYGILTLFVVMLLPLPDSPALLFFAMHEGNPLPVFAVTLLGKLLKYSFYAYSVRAFPQWFQRPKL